MTGGWDTDEPDDLGGFLTALAAQMATPPRLGLQRARAFVVAGPTSTSPTGPSRAS